MKILLSGTHLGSAKHYNKRKLIYAAISTFLLASRRLNELWSNQVLKFKWCMTASACETLHFADWNCLKDWSDKITKLWDPLIQEKPPNIVLLKFVQQYSSRTKRRREWSVDPSGIFLPLTELLQSPFRTEFSMGSRSRRYRRSLRRHRRFLQSYRRSLRRCRDPWGDRRPSGCRCWSLRDSLKHIKHYETHVKHYETL